MSYRDILAKVREVNPDAKSTAGADMVDSLRRRNKDLQSVREDVPGEGRTVFYSLPKGAVTPPAE